MVRIVHGDRFAGADQRIECGLLGGAERRRAPGRRALDAALGPPEQAAIVLDQPNVPFDRGIDQGRREAAIVVTLADDIAHGRRRQFVRRREDRHHRSGAGIASGALPGKVKEADQSTQAEHRYQWRRPVGQDPARPSGGGGRVDHALGKSRRHGKTLPRRQGRIGREADRPAAFTGDAGIAARFALESGIDRPLAEPGRRGQGDGYAGMVDRQAPAVAGDVPVQFVMTLEPPDHPRRGVADGVDMLADRDDHVGVTDLDPHPVVLRLNAVGFGLAVAAGFEQRKSNFHPLPARTVIARRNFATYAAVDGDILGLDADRLGDIDRAVLGDHDIAGEVDDSLLRQCRGRETQQKHRRQQQAHGAQPFRKSILGADWIAGSSSL